MPRLSLLCDTTLCCVIYAVVFYCHSLGVFSKTAVYIYTSCIEGHAAVFLCLGAALNLMPINQRTRRQINVRGRRLDGAYMATEDSLAGWRQQQQQQQLYQFNAFPVGRRRLLMTNQARCWHNAASRHEVRPDHRLDNARFLMTHATF